MGNFFKGIAKGLYNIAIIPVWLVGLLISAIAGLGVFFWQLILLIGRFFTGGTLSLDLPEDITAKDMLKPKVPEEKKEEKDDVEVVYAEIADPGEKYKEVEVETPPKHISTTAQQPQQSNEDVDFVIREEEPTQIEFANTMPEVINSEKVQEEPIIATPMQEEESSKQEEKEEEIIEMYSPKGSDF